MHDPEVLAHRIRIPWPRERFGLTLIEVWHYEPGGHDVHHVCKRESHWRWHVHHWKVASPLVHSWRRRLFTRCSWCGGRHSKRDRIDMSQSNWIGADHAPRRWWQGEANVAHHDCYSVATAHRLCLCDDPGLDHGDYGRCAFCNKFRAWRKEPTIPDRYLASLPIGARIPADRKDWLKSEWAKLRAEREAADPT